MTQKRRKKTIFNIGYQGRDIGGFIEILKDVGVTMVIDLRRKPISRIQGFSKRILRKVLAENGMGYWHMGHKLDGFNCTTKMWKNGCIEIHEWHQRNDEVLALMCMERDPLQCHRLEVSKVMETKFGYSRQCL